MDLVLFRQYQAETDEKKKRQLLGQIVKDNMGLVRKIVTKLVVRAGYQGEMDDLLQAGAMGLVRSLETYDPKIASFSTYAAHWIRDRVQQASSRAGMIYRPRGAGMPYQARVKQDAIATKEGRDATAEEMGVTEKEMRDWVAQAVCISLDAPRGAHEGQGQGASNLEGQAPVDLHNICQDETPLADETIEVGEEAQRIRKALDVLKPRDRRIIEALFFEEKSIAVVAAELGFTVQYIGQIRMRALDLLRTELSETVCEDGDADDGEEA